MLNWATAWFLYATAQKMFVIKMFYCSCGFVLLCVRPSGSLLHQRITWHSRHTFCPPVTLRTHAQRPNVSLPHFLTMTDSAVVCMEEKNDKASRQISFFHAVLVEIPVCFPKRLTFFLDLLLLRPGLHLQLLPHEQMGHVSAHSHSYHSHYLLLRTVLTIRQIM